MTLTLITIGRATLLAASSLALACGALPQLSADEVGCRATITAEGERSELAVRWYRVDDDRDFTFQNAWCAGVGPAIVHEAAMPEGRELLTAVAPEAARVVTADAGEADAGEAPTSTEPVLDSLLVVAFNAHIGSGDLDRLVADIKAGELTGRPVTHFVLLLQEVFRRDLGVPADAELPRDAPSGSRTEDAERVHVIEWADALGLHLLYVPSMRNGIGYESPEDRGNAILSTLPLSDLRALELPAGLQRRVAVVADVKGVTSAGNAWTLGVASAHLDNASLSNPLASLGSVRARQASGLVRMLPREGPLVVGGDFNTWFQQHEERAYQIMRDDFPWPREHQESPTAQRLGEGRIIDWLFFRGPEGWTFDDGRAPAMYGSDHYPVYGWVQIPPGGYEN